MAGVYLGMVEAGELSAARSVELRRARIEHGVRLDSPSSSPPKSGFTSVCGVRKSMEDTVAIHSSFSGTGLHYFGVFDGHGCSHVALKCKERLHQILKEEVIIDEDKEDEDEEADNKDSRYSNAWWKLVMNQSFTRMETEAVAWPTQYDVASCICSPGCDSVGSAAVVAVVTPHKTIVANCGDSRAVLCRNGRAFPLSRDHKPDRPDERTRIEAAGGRVISWDCARVNGVLSMSRAIGDTFLKPSVCCEPEVSITKRVKRDECLIIASDGLWDVVTNDTACRVAHVRLNDPAAPPPSLPENDDISHDRTCSDISMVLTKLALARGSNDNVSVVVVDLRRPSE